MVHGRGGQECLTPPPQELLALRCIHAEGVDLEVGCPDSAVGGFSLADYGEVGGIPVGVAGLIGVGLTILVGLALFWLLSRRADREKVSA